MATSTTVLGLIKPEESDIDKVRDNFNDNMDTIDGRFTSTYMAVQAKANVDITGGSITGITDLAIADGGTGSSTAANARTALSVASRALDNISSCAINAALLLGTSDAYALGSTSKMWSDLFLASGAVINFNNGDVTLTHGSNVLTMGGGNLALGSNSITITGSFADTTNRCTKGWFTDLQVTNSISGSITGTAAVATAFTCTDNESENLACPVVFVDGATGTQGAETDDTDFTYNPSTGNLSATQFEGITAANLVDKSATETISDNWTFTSTSAYGINITGANTTAQLYIAGTNILPNGEQAIWINCPSEDGATNGIWISLGSTVTSGDLTGVRSKVTTNATTGGDAASGQQTRAFYGQAIAATSDDAGLLQGGLFVADVSAGNCVTYNVHALCGHYSAGASATIGGDLYVGYLRAQSRSTNGRTVTGNDFLLALENEAVEGSGQVMDGAIRIFNTNMGVDGFTYGIDMSGADITTADIILQNGETISNATDGIVVISGTISGVLADGVTATTQSASDNSTKVATTAYADTAAAAGGATAALDNLASVQINTSLLSDTADTDDLGTTGAEWRSLYIGDAGKIYLGLGQDASIERNAANEMTLTASSGVTLSAGLTVGGDITLGANSIGRDADNDIDFETDNQILFRLNGTDGALFGATGELDMNANSIGFTQQTVTYASGTTTADWTNGNKAIMTFGAGNITTFAFTNPTNPCNLLLKVVQDGTGSRTVTAWDTDIKWVGGTKPTLSTGANAVDICSFYWDGTNYHGICSLAFAVPA